ncbi:hypothetical protein HAX54_025063, partial [Datura stramonium]|nr:hypothetical protein [Datura stramonium]
TKLKGVEVSLAEVFLETHKKKKKDDIREGWIEPRAEEIYTQPTSKDGSSTQPSSEDINSMWTNMTGGVKKDRVYGLGVQSSSYCPSSLLSGAFTSQCPEEIEEM